jgi:uncharacterized membrane protein YGL010W
MKSLVDHLSQYAAYHRDPRNIASHFIGIPLIVVAVAVLLSRPQGRGWLSPAVRCWHQRGFTCAWSCAWAC